MVLVSVRDGETLHVPRSARRPRQEPLGFPETSAPKVAPTAPAPYISVLGYVDHAVPKTGI